MLFSAVVVSKRIRGDAPTTLPPGAVGAIRHRGKRVSLCTVRLSRISCCGASAAKDILLDANKAEVCRIRAVPIVASGVIKLGNMASSTQWQWRNEPCVKKTVRVNVFHPIGCDTVAGVSDSAGPFPTVRSLVHSDLRKNASERLPVQVANCEKLLISHARYYLLLRLRVWLESRLCISTAATCLLYTAREKCA